MKALLAFVWTAAASALLANITLFPLVAAFVYSPDPAASNSGRIPLPTAA